MVRYRRTQYRTLKADFRSDHASDTKQGETDPDFKPFLRNFSNLLTPAQFGVLAAPLCASISLYSYKHSTTYVLNLYQTRHSVVMLHGGKLLPSPW